MQCNYTIWEERLLTTNYHGISAFFVFLFIFFADKINSLRLLLMYQTITIVQWCSSIKQMTSEASFKFPLNFLLLLQVTSSGTLKIISISLQNFHFAKGFAKV